MKKMEKLINHQFKIGYHIPGWQDELDLIQYAKLAKNIEANGTIIEVGSGLGQTTFSLSENSKDSVKVIAIDRWNGSLFNKNESPNCYNSNSSTYNNLQTFRNFIPNPKVETVQLISPPEQWNTKADLIFIDVDHEESSWIKNIDYWVQFLRPNGTLAGNDYLNGDLHRENPLKDDFKMIKDIINSKAHQYGKKVYNPTYSNVWFWY